MEFSYEASTAEGQAVAGQIEASSLADAIARLAADGLSVRSIKQLSPTGASVNEQLMEEQFAEERLQQTLQQKEALVPRLEAFADELPPSRWRQQLVSLTAAIKRGVPSEQLVARYPEWAPLLASGVSSAPGHDAVGDLMIRLTDHHDSRMRLWKAVTYPLALLAMAFAVLVAIGWTVMPMFEEIFSDFGLRLPAPTQLLVWFSQQLNDHALRFWLVIAFCVGVVAFLAWLWIEGIFTRSARPLAGQRAVELAAFTGRLAAELEAGVSLDRALRILGRGHASYRGRLANTLLHNLLTQTEPEPGLLPPNVAYAMGFNGVAAGTQHLEDSAHAVATTRSPNAAMLRQLSQLYCHHQWDRDERWYAVLSAFAVILVGMMVGYIVIALFMPLVSLVSGLS